MTFEELGLSPATIEAVTKAGYTQPTQIQQQAIPIVLEGRDVIGSAQTGTGKTATFTLPIVDRLAGRGGTLAVVLSPTREIAQQTFDAFETFGKAQGVRAVSLIGGVEMKPQLEALKTYPQVVIATPGRLVDHMERGSVWLDYVEVVVLDEADRMLDMGFIPQITRILKEIGNPDRQVLLFSATIPPAIEKLTHTFMRDPARITVGKPLGAATSVEHEMWIVSPDRKMSELRAILREEPGTVIVFSRSKKGAVEIWQSLHSAGMYEATTLHSDRTQEQRMQALADFKSGKFRVLIATDVAARGIDVPNVARVVNFDVPLVPEDYVHRIGRTGRASAKGRATTLATYRDRGLVRDIEQMLKVAITVTKDTTGGAGAPEGGGGGRESSGGRGGRDSGGRSGGGDRRPRGRSGGGRGGSGGGGRSGGGRGPGGSSGPTGGGTPSGSASSGGTPSGNTPTGGGAGGYKR